MGTLNGALGARIAEARKAAGFTQIQLAAVLGIEQSYLSRWERGKVRPSERYREALTQALGRDVFPERER
jgi:transcriptional regulator with XRE-family HTH domain